MGRKLLKYGVGLIVIVSLGIVLFVWSVHLEFFGHLYTKKELREFRNETATRVLASNGIILGKFFKENRTNVSYDDIPSHVVDALVATEDARYFEHEGVDSRSLIRVLFKTILLDNERSGGGSTITQQLLKNMYGRRNYGPLTMLVNKTKEGLLAYRIESIYSKEEILSLYLNTVPFGENVYGIEAASRLFYNKSVSDITVDQGAVLIGMLKANTYYNPRLYPEHAFTRRNVVLSQMEKYGYLSETESDSISELPIQLDYANLESQGIANYFLVQVKKELNDILNQIEHTSGKKWDYRSDGLVVETTLDYDLQNAALSSFENHLSTYQKKLRQVYSQGSSKKALDEMVANEVKRKGWRDIKEKSPREVFSWKDDIPDSLSIEDSLKLMLTTLHAGLIGMDPNTGEIKAWVGGIDYRTNPYDQVHASRQMASTFKPILYGAALEKGIMPCTYLSNSPQTFTDYENWSPSNYDLSTGGHYSLTGALVNSKNVPSVDLLFQVGFDEVDYLWRKMGFSQELEFTPSMALGTGSASAYEVAIAYASYANGGKKVTPKTISRILDSSGNVVYQLDSSGGNEIVSEQTSILMNEMLQKAINSGTGTAIRTTYGISTPIAGKTGTSQNYADAWFVGYNPSLVMVSRVGASSPNIHFRSGRNGSGGRLALPLVAMTLKSYSKKHPSAYVEDFESIDSTYFDMLNCPDFREDTGLDKIKLFFQGDETNTKKRDRKARKKEKRRRRKKDRD